MDSSELISLRLRNQHLVSPDFSTPEDVVEHFGAIQAQDFGAAKWSVGLRMRRATDEIVENAFNAGRILRTHVMRPTWHFVMPEDIRWMLELTAPGVRKILAPYDKRLDIDARLLSRCHTLIGKALEGGAILTRAELSQHLGRHGVEASGQRLGHIMAYMELDALVCSGPRRGKQMTYTMLEERVPKAELLTREQSLAKLAGKYFTSHGPAQLKDFAWWSGLPLKEATTGLDSMISDLHSAKVGEKTYYFKPDEKAGEDKSQSAFLLSIYDEYTIAYKDRSAMSEGRPQDIETMLSMGNALTSVLVINGKVAGTWKRILEKDRVEIKLSPFRALSPAEKDSVHAAADRYGSFWNLKVDLNFC